MSFLQMSLHGAVMIAVITILRALVLNKVPKKTFLVLWAMALVRLLVPFSLPSRLSVYTLFARQISRRIRCHCRLSPAGPADGARHCHAAGHCAFRTGSLAVDGHLARGHRGLHADVRGALHQVLSRISNLAAGRTRLCPPLAEQRIRCAARSPSASRTASPPR